MAAFIDLTGHVFGRLTVLERATPIGVSPLKFRCQCACGEVCVKNGHELRGGITRSCGCLRRELQTAGFHLVHGHARVRRVTPTYRSWQQMRTRCSAKPGTWPYPYYGARGITVCERWNSFENFLADMGERPAGKSLDRINNDGNYEPGNCRWATRSEQRCNQRRHAHLRAMTPEQRLAHDREIERRSGQRKRAKRRAARLLAASSAPAQSFPLTDPRSPSRSSNASA